MTVAESTARQKLEVGRIVLQSFVLTARAAPVLIPLAILNEVLGRGTAWLITGANPLVFMVAGRRHMDPSLLQSLLDLPEQFIRALVYSAAIWAAYTVFRGRRATPGNMFAAWSRALIPTGLVNLVIVAFGATFIPLNWGLRPIHSPLVMGLSFLGLLIWLVVYCLVALAWWLAANLAIIEGRDAVTAFRRSAALTRGNRWRILWTSVLVAVPVIVGMFLLWGVSGVGMPPRVPVSLLTPMGVGSVLLQMAIGILLSSSSAIIYAERCGAVDPAPQAEVFS
jgi:hypothetical protein